MKFSLLLFIPLLSSICSAQFSVGLKAGANFSIYTRSLMADETAPPGVRAPSGKTGNGTGVGPLFGGFFSYQVNDKWSFNSELLFSSRKFRNNGNYQLWNQIDFLTGSTYTLFVNYDDRTTLSYLELPLLASYKMNDRWSSQAGLGLGFMLGAKTKYRDEKNFGGVRPTTIEEGVFKSTIGYSGTEVALCVGTMYELDNGVNLGLRYWCALNPVNQYTENMKLRANVFQLSVGYGLFKKTSNS